MAFKYPFTGKKRQDRYENALKANYEDLPKHYSEESKKLVKSMLTTNSALRPSLKEVLRIIKNKLKGF